MKDNCIKRIKNLLIKYQGILLYGIFGVLTTAVNIISYWALAHVLEMHTMPSTILAWIFSVCFAYLTNRKWVFCSTASTAAEYIKEITSFFSCRIATGLLDWACMFVFVTLLSFHDVLVKVLANVVVIVLNYVASKFLIFKHQ